VKIPTKGGIPASGEKPDAKETNRGEIGGE